MKLKENDPEWCSAQIAALRPSPLYDICWTYAAERQNIFMKRVQGVKPPWTDDKTLQDFRFTNTYRVLDRVSQYLIKSVIGRDNAYSGDDLFFRIVLFKLFNKIETWEQLERMVGDISFANYNFDRYDRAFSSMIKRKETIYSAAYIMPSGVTSFGFPKKHENNLKLLEMMMNDSPAGQIKKMKSLGDLYSFFLNFPTIGPFLAFQYAIDINYSNLCDFSEMDFVVPGPGAIRGIQKCFPKVKKSFFPTLIRLIAEAQTVEFAHRGLTFHYLGSRKLQLIDIQNLFCEIDKYSRRLAAYQKAGHRIKQKYKINPKKIDFVFPEKWHISFSMEDAYGIDR